MTPREVNEWIWFYSQQPFDDFHRYHRPAALISTSMGGGEIQARLDWLQYRPLDPEFEGYDQAAMNTMKAFGLKPPKKG
jgi:hypothetical protein